MASPLLSVPLPATAQGLAADGRGLAGLKASAGQSPEKAVKAAAREFEALFLNQVMKSMRESLPKDGPFHSNATQSYTQMLDHELSRSLSARGTGLAAMIEKQLARSLPAKAGVAGAASSATASAAAKAYVARPAPGATHVAKASAAPAAKPASPAKAAAAESQRSFLSKVMAFAQGPAAAAGLSPVFVAAQAALESGWGKHEIRHADGAPAHNLFGVKAGRAWTGATVDVTTTEYENGVAVKKVEKFRAYASYAEGLADYVGLLAGNRRYQAAVAAGQDAKGFATALAKAGYATDPAYGAKLSRLIDQARTLTGQA